MELYNLIEELLNNKNELQSLSMSAYMRNQFQFLGIPTPLRKKLCKEYFKSAKKEGLLDWQFINLCWDNPFRELQYVAMDYLASMQKFLTQNDIPNIKLLAISKSWWDTIDGLDRIVGNIALLYPEVKSILLEWSVDENIWLRRIAIDHQLLRKEKTDTELLAKIIINNFGSSEFFINKAIGWSLRDYSKTNPEWVKSFLNTHQSALAPLSIREASKYL